MSKLGVGGSSYQQGNGVREVTNEDGAGAYHGQARRQKSLLGACSQVRLPFVSGWVTILRCICI